MPLAESQKPDESRTPVEVSGKKVLDGIGSLLKDEKDRRDFLKHILGNEEKRPINWAKSSNPPYYRERFAKQLQVHLDEMMKDLEDRLYRYEDFNWLSKNSLYLMLNQAFKYLEDHLDPDGKYAAFHQLLSITKDKDTYGNPKGIRMSLVKDARTGVPTFKSHKVADAYNSWREDMENFIEEAREGDVFFTNKVVLTPEEIAELKYFLEDCHNIIGNITETQVKLVRVAEK